MQNLNVRRLAKLGLFSLQVSTSLCFGRKLIRSFCGVVVATSLAACAQSPALNRSLQSSLTMRQAALQTDREQVVASRLNMSLARVPASDGSDKTDPRTASSGLASFYTEGTQTASGEKFDTTQLTAAHRTLPFGTQLLVTNIATGRSVTVRVNDRGPFIKGRVVDVSYAAAKALGMIDTGVANVKVSVLQ